MHVQSSGGQGSIWNGAPACCMAPFVKTWPWYPHRSFSENRCAVSLARCLAWLLFFDVRSINGKRRRGATSFPVSLRAIKDVEGLQVPDEEEEQPRAQFIFGVRSSRMDGSHALDCLVPPRTAGRALLLQPILLPHPPSQELYQQRRQPIPEEKVPF